MTVIMANPFRGLFSVAGDILNYCLMFKHLMLKTVIGYKGIIAFTTDFFLTSKVKSL